MSSGTPLPRQTPMVQMQETEIISACRILFGPGVDVTREFLHYLQPEGVRHAYRNRARECHPDSGGRYGNPDKRTELFRRSVEAYELLNDFLQNRKPTNPLRSTSSYKSTRPQPVRRPQIKVERAANEKYYSGPLPALCLKLGLYLYYSGAVSYQALVRSLLWQRSQRPPLGEFACSWGWIDKEAVPVILSATHLVGPFGERAVKLGLLSESQLNILVLHQRFIQQPIGRYFVKNSLLTESELLRHLRELARHNEQVRKSRC
jgi:hypothetical protein